LILIGRLEAERRPKPDAYGELDAALARSRYEPSQMAGNEKRGALRATAAVRDR